MGRAERLGTRVVRRIAHELTQLAALRAPPQTYWRGPQAAALAADAPKVLPAPAAKPEVPAARE